MNELAVDLGFVGHTSHGAYRCPLPQACSQAGAEPYSHCSPSLPLLRGARYSQYMVSDALVRRCVIVGFLVLPAVAFGSSGGSKPAPNVVGLEAGAGSKALFKSGIGAIGRYTINCPTLHVGRSLRIAWQKPAAGTSVHAGQAAIIVVAREAQPKAHRTEPLPQGLTRSRLCNVVAH